MKRYHKKEFQLEGGPRDGIIVFVGSSVTFLDEGAVPITGSPNQEKNYYIRQWNTDCFVWTERG